LGKVKRKKNMGVVCLKKKDQRLEKKARLYFLRELFLRNSIIFENTARLEDKKNTN